MSHYTNYVTTEGKIYTSTITINQKEVLELYEKTNTKGIILKGHYYKASLKTFVLLDFLKQHEKLFTKYDQKVRIDFKDEYDDFKSKGFIYVSYQNIKNNVPLCNFDNGSLKRHLNILEYYGLVLIRKGKGGYIYFTTDINKINTKDVV